MAHDKRTKNPIAKILRYFKPKTFKIKKPTRVKVVSPHEKLNSFVEEIGKDMFGIRVRVEWGRCPYCESIAQMLSTRLGYSRCSNCHETTKQYVNGKIAYLPVDDAHVLGDEPKA